MDSITEFKDNAAKNSGYKDFMAVLKSFDCAKSTYADVNIIINEAMKEHAKQVAEAQRKACADNIDRFERAGTVERVKSAKLVTDNI